MFDYEVKIASTEVEIKKALKLRYEVFNLEIGKDPTRDFNPALDIDAYDHNCDHLIVIDKDKDKVVGTYRLCLGKNVNKDLGFYSERTFDISNIKKINGNTMELGRACVHEDYRDQLVIN
jgi:putative hemolysin